MSFAAAARSSCRACLTVRRSATKRAVRFSPRPAFSPPHRSFSTESTNNPSTSSPPPAEATQSRSSPSESHKELHTAHAKFLEARARAEKQLRALLKKADSSARKQAQAFSAALQALEIERKLREVGGKINQATGYEEIERLRNGVGEKEKGLLEVRMKAAELKQEYSDRVKLRADSQREVNDLLQRKSTWNSSDVLRFTSLVQQDHENEQAELRAKIAMDEGDQAVEKSFTKLMQAILERYHEEQVWSDKIRSLSTYGSLAITTLNVLLFIITLLLIEPWRRRKLVEKVEERLRTNTQEGHDTTNAKLESFQALLQEAQGKLDELAASTAVLAAMPSSPAPVAAPSAESPLPPNVPLIEEGPADAAPTPPPPPPLLTRTPLPHPLLDQARDALEGHEMIAAGAAGAVGGIVLAAVISLLSGGR